MGFAVKDLEPKVLRSYFLKFNFYILFLLSVAFGVIAEDSPICSVGEPPSTIESLLYDRNFIANDFAFSLTGSEHLRSDSSLPRGKLAIADGGFLADRLGSRMAGGAYQADSSDQHHGTGTANVALEASRHAELTALFKFEELRDSQSMERKLRDLKQNNLLPTTINISYSMGNDPRIRQSIKRMMSDEFNITVVASTGNDGDDPLDANNRIPGVIYVGSISPYGLVDGYSQSGAEVSILAPVGMHLGVDYGSGKALSYGTSFASPQVAAAIADLKAILPNLKSDEIQTMLRLSAVRTINTEDHRNGAGMLNHLRLIAVAKKIKENPFLDLSDPDTYKLANDSKLAIEQAERSASREERLSLLQKAFLLDPEGSYGQQARALLAKDPGMGLLQNFYESLDFQHTDEYLAKQQASDDKYTQDLANRTIRLLQNKASSVLASNFSAKHPEFVQNYLDEILLSTGFELDKEILDSLLREIPRLQDPNQRALSWAALILHLPRDSESAEQVKQMFLSLPLDEDPIAKEFQKRFFSDTKPESAEQVNQKAVVADGYRSIISSPDRTLKLRAFNALSKLNSSSEIKPSLNSVNKDDPELMAAAEEGYRLSLVRASAESLWELLSHPVDNLRQTENDELIHRLQAQQLLEADHLSAELAAEIRSLVAFSEPKALRHFVRAYLFAANSYERKEIEVELVRLLEIYRVGDRAEAENRLALALHASKVHSSLLIREAAEQALIELKPS